MAILVTGAAGLIGSNVARRLVEEGRDVVALDVVRPSGKPHVLDDVLDRVNFQIGSVADLALVLNLIKQFKIEGIIHLGAVVGEPANYRPIEALHVNVIGPANMLEAGRIMGLKRVVITSSSAVMGAPEYSDTPRKEEDIVLPATGIYALSKLTAEQLTHTYRTLYGVDAISVRPRVVWGPGSRWPSHMPVSVLCHEALAGKPIRHETGADTPYDHTYVKDFAKGIIQGYDCKAPKHYVYNLSFGRNTRVSEVCEVLKRLFPKLSMQVGPGLWEGVLPRGEQRDLTYRTSTRPPQDVSKARADFGYNPEWTLDRAIPDYIRWLREGKYN